MTADGIATQGSLLSGVYQAVKGWLITGTGTSIIPETVTIEATCRTVTTAATCRIVALTASARSVTLEVTN